MKFKRVTVTKNQYTMNEKVIGQRDYATIFEKENVVLATYNENKTDKTENQLWVMDIKGKGIEMYITDVRFTGMWADLMRFTGYLLTPYKKHKSGLKVDVNVWT